MLKQIILFSIVISSSYLALAGSSGVISISPAEARMVKSRIENMTLNRLYCMRSTLQSATAKKPTYRKDTRFANPSELPLETLLVTMNEVRLIDSHRPDREFDIFVFSNLAGDEVILRFNRLTFQFISYRYTKSKVTGLVLEGDKLTEKIQIEFQDSCS